jgi:hypothetical protein
MRTYYKYLNEEQYINLTKECDRLLFASDTSLERVSIPWLHVIREHPVPLKKYEEIYFSAYSEMLNKYARKLRNWVYLFYSLLKNLRNDGKSWYESDTLPNQTDVLFISHLQNIDHAGKAEDFYFGSLPEKLYENECSVVVALLNHMRLPSKTLVSRWSKSVGKSFPRVVFSKYIGISKEIKIFNRLRLESDRLFKKTSLKSSNLFRRVLSRASDEAFSPGAQMTLRLSEQIGELVYRINPKVVVFTHEGHAWERCACYAISNIDSDILRIAYQHSAVFRLQYAIKRKLIDRYNPDQILVSGEISYRQLSNSEDLKSIPISILGSNRYIENTHQDYKKISKRNTCLVIPEAYIEECNFIFEFCLDCALQLPKVRFIWRVHPMFNAESILENNKKLANLPNNVVLSNSSLESDISHASCVLYRGSTAVVQSVVSGLRPFYFRIKGELTIDPLYELSKGREIVENPYEFVHKFNKQPDLNDMKQAVEYCEKFYLPLNIPLLQRIAC